MHDSRLHEEIEDPYISQHHGNPEHTSALPDCDREFIKEPPYTLLHKKKLCTACLQQWPTNDSPAGYTSVCRSHPNSSTIFSNSNLVVMGGKFVAAIQTTTGWNKLVDTIPMNVLHDSASRCNAPRCVVGEHERVRAKIMDTLENEAEAQRVIWVHGPSDTSCIAQSIADACASLNIHPATFFFTTAADEQYALLIPTLAYQLCLLVPEARPIIGQAIDDDPAILSRSPIIQLRNLILHPLNESLHPHLQESPPRLVIIVDAMDNCSSAQQQVLVEVIVTAAENVPLPVKFLMFSKRSLHMQRALVEILGPRGANYITEIATATPSSPQQYVDENVPRNVFLPTKMNLILLSLLLAISLFQYVSQVKLYIERK